MIGAASPSGRCRTAGLAVLLALSGLWSAPSTAQSPAPTSGEDLTLPPEWRQGALPHPSASAMPRPARATVTRRSAGAMRTDDGTAALKPTRAHPGAEHPVDLGVVVRGGSGTPRVYGQTGTSQPLQESGSAFGAGMRVGF